MGVDPDGSGDARRGGCGGVGGGETAPWVSIRAARRRSRVERDRSPLRDDATAPAGSTRTSIRVEQGDTVYVTIENTHYFPHTVHLHGTDHPFEVQGKEDEGNDGVPQSSEKPIEPGEERTYKLTPRQPGTMFNHCHVVPNVHISMGLNGLFVIEEDRDNNWVQTFNLGAGKVRHPSKSTTRTTTASTTSSTSRPARRCTTSPSSTTTPVGWPTR